MGQEWPRSRLQSSVTGLLAWKHGQPGQVGNEAALTVVTSAEIRLVTSPVLEDRPRGGLFVGAVAMASPPNAGERRILWPCKSQPGRGALVGHVPLPQSTSCRKLLISA